MSTQNGKSRFHGMTVISDQDQLSVKGKMVLELHSSGSLAAREYDENGLESDNPILIDLYSIDMNGFTESNVTGAIKREIGSNSLLISEGAVQYIDEFIKAINSDIAE